MRINKFSRIGAICLLVAGCGGTGKNDTGVPTGPEVNASGTSKNGGEAANSGATPNAPGATGASGSGAGGANTETSGPR